MQKFNLKSLILVLAVLAVAALVAIDTLGFRGSVAGTIGPGVYPLITLALMFLFGLIIALRAFVPVHYTLLSPFATSSLQGLAMARLANVLSGILGQRVAVKSGVGQGYFSSFYAGCRAKPDGHTIVVLSGARPTPSVFSNAAESRECFEPVMQLSSDPLLLVGPARGGEPGGPDLPALLADGSLGFSAQHEAAGFLVSAIAELAGVEVKSRIYGSTPLLIRALSQGEIKVGVAPLSDLSALGGSAGQYRVLAAGEAQRLPELPDTPTMRELGVDLLWSNWVVLALPQGTEPQTVRRLWQELSRPEAQEEIRRGMLEHGIAPRLQGPAEVAALWRAQAKVADLIGRHTDYWQPSQERRSLQRVLAGFALFTAFMLLAPLTGYLPSALGFMLILTLLLWPGPLKRALPLLLTVSLGSGLAVYLIFTQAFQVVFP